MGKFFLALLIIGGIFFGGYYYLNNEFPLNLTPPSLSRGTIVFGTQEFAAGGVVPSKFTCDGKDINPTMFIERVPDTAKSLVVIMDDPDAKPEKLTHWILFNISPDETLIEEGEIPPGSRPGINDFGKNYYQGPCPPLGIHKYFFRIYALDTVLSLDENTKREDLDRAMKGHVIAEGETWGEYTK
jgi:Raf kinase inhibitor-like YbhB/YbcL family protein